MATPSSGPPGSTLIYLYGFVETVAGPVVARALEFVAGVDGKADVRLVQEGAFVAVVSDVPEGEFSAEALARRLNELGSLEDVARGHERVLDAVVAVAPVLPARLATLHSREEDLGRVMATQGVGLRPAFDRVRGHREWGVKLFVERDRLLRRLRAPAEPHSGPRAAAGAPGTAYLAERRRAQELERQLDDELREVAADVHRRLLDRAREARLLPARPGTGDARELALNAAFLVSLQDEPDFRMCVERLDQRLRERGFTVEATGPWPPYNFLEEAR